MLANLFAVLALSHPVGLCETIKQLAKPADEQAAAKPADTTEAPHHHAQAEAGNTLESRLDELGQAVKNLSQQISTNTKQGAKSADDRIRKEFETIKKGLVEATNGVEAKAKETGGEVSSELKVALKRLSKSIDELANKISKQ